MAHAYLLYDDRVPAATLSGAATVAGLPVTNLQDPQPSRVARWTGTTCHVVVDFGAATPVGMVVLAGTNLTTTTTRRLRLSSTDATGAAGDVHDSGTAAAGADARFNGSFAYMLAADLAARYLRVDLTDAGLAFIDVGLLMAGPAFRPGRNFSFGHELGYQDFGLQEPSPVGTLFASDRRRVRATTLRFDYATEAEAMAALLEMKRITGVTRNIAVVPNPGGAYPASRLVVGVVADLVPIRNNAFNIWSDVVSVVERI